MLGVKPITDQNFSELVLQPEKIALVEFSAKWCGPCKAMAPAISDLAAEFEEEADIYVMDIDESTETAQQYQVRAVPTFALFKGGELIHRQSGATTRSALSKLIEGALTS